MQLLLYVLALTSNLKVDARVQLNNTKQPPCIDAGSSSEIQSCCALFDDIFGRNNIKQIMMMMKHSLEFSIPWLQEYSDSIEKESENEFWIENALAKLRQEGTPEKYRNAFPMNGDFNFLEDFG